MPEFERQKQDNWSYRSRQSIQKVQILITQSLGMARSVIQSVDGNKGVSGLGVELFAQSKAESLFVRDTAEQKNFIELHKNERLVRPQRGPTAGDFQYFFNKDLFWVVARVNTFEITLAFKAGEVIDFDETEPVIFFYHLAPPEIIMSSRAGFQLESYLFDRIKAQPLVELTDYSKQSPQKLMVTGVLPDLNLGVGVFGENAQVQNTWKQLSYQYIGVILLLSGLAVILSLGFVRLITKKLEVLQEKSSEIGQGNFDIQLDVAGQDEVGQLSFTIRKMAMQIKDLFNEKEKQLRMESELKIAQTVQGTLFPPSSLLLEKYEISGFYRSASECGGDLWGYWETNNYLYLFIIDATGHGVPAALITSASRAVAAIFETQESVDIKAVASGFNYAINKVGNNLQQATAFLCQVEKASGKLEYVNASHVSGYVFPSDIQESTKVKNIEMLYEPITIRLGEQEVIPVESGSYQLAEGETLVLVTDGLFDMNSLDGKGWQERRVIKAMIKTLSDNKDSSLQSFTNIFVDQVFSEHGSAELKDDVTLLSLKRIG